MNFNNKKTEERFVNMLPRTQKLAIEMDAWAREQGVELVFTETWTTATEDFKLNRQSDTHRTGRAFDIRTKNLSAEFIKKFIAYFTELYNEKYGAVTKSGPSLIVYRPHGTGPHFHVQIRRGLK